MGAFQAEMQKRRDDDILEQNMEAFQAEVPEQKQFKDEASQFAAFNQNAERTMIRDLLESKNVEWFLKEHGIEVPLHQIQGIENLETAEVVLEALALGGLSNNTAGGIMAAQKNKEVLDSPAEREKYVRAFQAEVLERRDDDMLMLEKKMPGRIYRQNKNVKAFQAEMKQQREREEQEEQEAEFEDIDTPKAKT